MCEAYRHVIAFEHDNKRQTKMQRRRAALLEPLVEALSPKVYADTLLVLAYEVAEVYVGLQSLKEARITEKLQRQQKIQKLKTLPPASPAEAARFREYAQKAIHNFDVFFKMINPDSEELSEFVPPERHMRSFVRASLHSARMMSKTALYLDRAQSIARIEEACTRFKSLQQFTDKHLPVGSEERRDLKQELELVKESLELLPVYKEHLARRSNF